MSEPSVPTIACSTVSLFATPLHDVFPLLAETGYRGIEVMVTKDPDTRNARTLRDLAEDSGVALRAIHAPFLLVTRSVWGTDPVAKIERAVELARDVEAPLVVVHPPYRWQARYRRWLADRLPERTRETGIRVAVENMFPVRVRGQSVGALHAVRTLDHLEGFEHVALDTSHAAVAGVDPVDAVERLGGRLAHIHLSNNAGRGWDSHLPLDEGILRIDRFLDALAARGYAGTISLEIDLRRFASNRDALRRRLADNRELCAAHLPLAV
jgi:sugar phosphate isomerase/epimerase